MVFRCHFGDNGRRQLSQLQEIVGHFLREYLPRPDRCKNNPLKHVCLEACNFCLRRWATFDHIKSLPKTALPDHIHIIDVFFVHVYTVCFDIFIYVMCMYLIYIYTLKYVHQHLGLDFHILGSKKWFIPHYIIMGLQIVIEIRGTRLPTPKRFPWTSAACAAALPKAWTRNWNVSGWCKDGGHCCGSRRYWFHWYLVGGFKHFLFSPRTLGKWSNLTNIFQIGWNQ